MTKIYKVIIAVLFFACACLFASQANARVCFATDPDCGSGGNFSEIDPDYMSNLCLENGYTSIATDCQSTVGMQIGAYCPYDHKYAICCGLEYAYTKCTPPLKAAGVCGGKLKCECDTSKFAYMQKTASVCRNVLNGTEYTNSRGAGGSCSYMGYDHTLQASMINIRFAECTCDRGLYPKTEEECSSIGASTAGNVCTDSNGNNFYSSCLCGPEYKYISSDCKYGTYVKDPLCQQGDVYKTKSCCDCNSATYPYADYGDIDESVETYATCEHERGCTRGSRYRATSCKLGYKLGSGTDSGKCVPKTCGEIVQDYLTDKKITTYQVYQAGKTPTVSYVIIGDDTEGASWSNFNSKKVVSGQSYAQTISGSDPLVKLMKAQCTKTPTLMFKYDSATDTTSGTYNFESIALDGSLSNWNHTGTFTCTNCGLNLKAKLTNTGTINLNYVPTKPNADNMYVTSTSTIDISGIFIATGYDFDVQYMNITKNAVQHNFIGRSVSDKNTFKVYKLSIREALAMLKNMNATVSYTYMGIPSSNTSVNSVGQYWYYTKTQGCGNDNNYYRTGFYDNGTGTPSALHLYNTTYTVGMQLWMSSMSRLGQGLNDGTGLPETGTIKFAGSSSRSFTNLFYPLPKDKSNGTWSASIIREDGSIGTATFAAGLLKWSHNDGDGAGSVDSYCYMDNQGIPHDGMGEHRSGGHGGSDGCRSDKCRYFHDCGSGDCRITDDDRDCQGSQNCYVFRHMYNGSMRGISKSSISN